MRPQDLPAALHRASEIILGSVAMAALLYFLAFAFSILGAIYQ